MKVKTLPLPKLLSALTSPLPPPLCFAKRNSGRRERDARISLMAFFAQIGIPHFLAAPQTGNIRPGHPHKPSYLLLSYRPSPYYN
jgi:hypothetical protein